MKCCVCLRDGEKKGGVSLCARHSSIFLWDEKEGYLRQRKHGGKWEGIWPSQASVAKMIEQVGYKVDQEVRPLWALGDKGALLPYYMAVPELKVLVEYQGEQHYHRVRLFFKTKALWAAFLQRQKLKKELAKQNGWQLVEITYKDKPLTHTKVMKKIKEALDAH